MGRVRAAYGSHSNAMDHLVSNLTNKSMNLAVSQSKINDADFGQDGEYMSPNTIFNLYKSDEFVFAIFQQSYENGKAITQIECKPRDPDSEYSKMRLTVEDHINAVKRFKIFAKDGSRFTMILNFHKKDVKLEEGTFRFDPEQYDDIIIEDLRF